MSALLQVSAVETDIGGSRILRGVNLEVNSGEVVALMGRNGAGKSTTLKALMGMVARRGSVQFLGQDIARREPHDIARLGLGYVPEERRIFTDLFFLNNPVDYHTAYWDTKFIKPVYKSRYNRNRKAFGKRCKEKGGQSIVCKKTLRLCHPILKSKQICQQRIFFIFL